MTTTTSTTSRPSTARVAVRVLLYGLAIWLVWASVVITVAEAFPAATTSPLFASTKVSLVVVLVLVAMRAYRRRVDVSSTAHAVLVGTAWAIVMIALDLSHYAMVPFDVGYYLAHYAPAYLVVPVLTALASARIRTPRAAIEETAGSTR